MCDRFSCWYLILQSNNICCVYLCVGPYIVVNIFYRVKAYIQYGWADTLVDPDNVSATSDESYGAPDTSDWVDIKQFYTSPDTVPNFTNAQIVSYFVTRQVCDTCLCGDFKAINKSAMNLFHCGHLQQVEVFNTHDTLWLRAYCLPEMKKDITYKVELSILNGKWEISGTICRCPAGKGPAATCKHIGALCYLFQSFCENGTMPEFFTCTQRLQEWSQSRARKLDARPVTDLKEHKIKINAVNLNRRESSRTPSTFDPRPLHLRSASTKALDILRADLLSFNQPSAFNSILVPCPERALRDHSYSRKPEGDTPDSATEAAQQPPTPAICLLSASEMRERCVVVKEGLQVSSSVRQQIEEATRLQSQCYLWYEVRQKRITGYKCGQILRQKTRTPALLKSVLYSKPLIPLPVPIKWGQEHEAVAREAYVKTMQLSGHTTIAVKLAGFIIHPREGWFGSSPDGVVIDSVDSTYKGLLEVKCPYTKRDVSPTEACKDPNFYCYIADDGKFTLKRCHQYYDQVQLQLYVSSDLCEWCDFCVYTTKGLMIERIYSDSEWVNRAIPQLNDYFECEMLPEIVYPLYKPSYYL